MELLKIAEVCELMKVSRASVYRRINDADFPLPIRIGKRSRVWNRSEVLAWIAARS
jgi:predicted DNA-binding transcriptional regulator AlpA